MPIPIRLISCQAQQDMLSSSLSSPSPILVIRVNRDGERRLQQEQQDEYDKRLKASAKPKGKGVKKPQPSKEVNVQQKLNLAPMTNGKVRQCIKRRVGHPQSCALFRLTVDQSLVHETLILALCSSPARWQRRGWTLRSRYLPGRQMDTLRR